MSSSRVNESEVFTEGASNPKLTVEEIHKIEYSVKHTGAESLRKELRQHPDMCSGCVLDDMSLEELKELAVHVRITKGIVPKSKVTKTSWAQSKSSTTSVADDDDTVQGGLTLGPVQRPTLPLNHPHITPRPFPTWHPCSG